MLKCRDCERAFEPNHFNEKLCSQECKYRAVQARRLKYKKSEKGQEAEKKWRQSPAKLKIDKRYRASSKGRMKAVERVSRYVKENSHALFRKRLGQTAPYRRLRQEMIEIYKNCQHCGTDQDLTLDHIVPTSHGGNHSRENIQVLCRSCNVKKMWVDNEKLS